MKTFLLILFFVNPDPSRIEGLDQTPLVETRWIQAEKVKLCHMLAQFEVMREEPKPQKYICLQVPADQLPQ